MEMTDALVHRPRFTVPALAGVAVTLLLVFGTLLPAKADDFAQRITINVAPVWLLATNGDATKPPPPGFVPLGYGKDQSNANAIRFDYGVDLKIDEKTHLSFSHGNVGYQLGRILLPPNTSLVTNALYDYTDTIALSYAVGNGLGIHGTYFDHQRNFVGGLCLNQTTCLDAAGGVVRNPLSIDEHGYTIGFGYDVGPKTRIGSLFSVGGDVKYVPRPSTPSSPNVALGGLRAYKGSQVVFPWSVTMKVPVLFDKTVTPFINYTNLPVLYRDSAVPEEYRGIVWGLSKVVSKNITFSYTNLNLQSCRCVPRVPPPDNLRLAFGIMKLDFHTQL